MRRVLPILMLALLLTGCASIDTAPSRQSSITLHDKTRDRDIPIELYFPAAPADCSTAKPCLVAFLSPGYGMPHTAYSFIASTLNDQGYLVVAIQNQSPNDPPLPSQGNLRKARTPSWAQSAQNIHFVRNQLTHSHPQFAWHHLVLIGHSNGGDISTWFAHESPEWVTSLITLDHRRMPLPRNGAIKVLSIRAGDFPADEGVLPESDACIVTLDYARHNDMHDGGSNELRQDISRIVADFMRGNVCRNIHD